MRDMDRTEKIKKAIILIEEVVDSLTGEEIDSEIINRLVDSSNWLYEDLDKKSQKYIIDYLEKKYGEKRRQIKLNKRLNDWWNEYQRIEGLT